jgi:hypothetical protein
VTSGDVTRGGPGSGNVNWGSGKRESVGREETRGVRGPAARKELGVMSDDVTRVEVWAGLQRLGAFDGKALGIEEKHSGGKESTRTWRLVPRGGPEKGPEEGVRSGFDRS